MWPFKRKPKVKTEKKGTSSETEGSDKPLLAISEEQKLTKRNAKHKVDSPLPKGKTERSGADRVEIKTRRTSLELSESSDATEASSLDDSPVLRRSSIVISVDPPKFHVDHYTLTLDQVAEYTGAAKAHENGVTGKGVHVVIIDSGYFPHPYFKEKYPDADITPLHIKAPRFLKDPNPTPAPGEPGQDLNGHGTAMVANVLAMAPQAKITMIVCKSDLEALRHAFTLKPDVISVSRGPTYGKGKGATNEAVDRSELIDTYHDIIAQGKQGLEREPILLDAVGNVGARGMLSLLPGVISVGGTYRDEDGRLEASSYTNAYAMPKDIYVPPSERKVPKGDSRNIVTKTELPDITGLCGTEQHPDYLALPTQPGSELERKGTRGWGLASGSSCATPQVAGACALLKQVNPRLTVHDALAILKKTAVPVKEGKGFGPDGLKADGDWSRLIRVDETVKLAKELL